MDAPDIMETWLSGEIFSSELNIRNYQIVRKDRNRHGGGVLFYVSSQFCVKCTVLQ